MEPEDVSDDDIFGIDKRVSKRKKKIIMYSVIAAGTICLIVILALIFNLAGKFKGGTSTEEVAPNLVGEVYETIKTEYEAKGITITLDKYDYSSEIEDGKIISQSIEEGKTMPSNTIKVVVSKGAKKVKMVDVVGKDYTVAKYELEALGVVPEFEMVVDAKVLENIIISQDVEKDAEVKVGDTVKIKVSKGDGKVKVVVPNVISMSEAEATKTLQNLKFKVSVTYSPDSSRTNGIVLVQSKKQNEEAEEGTLIELTVNRLEKSKDVSIDVKDYINEATETSATLKVVAKVEGVTNTIHNSTVQSPFAPVTVTVNGFTTANISIYVNGKLVKDQTVTF